MHQKRTGRAANRASGNTAGPANPTAQGPPRYVRRLSLGFTASAYSAFWFALHSLYFRLGVLLARVVPVHDGLGRRFGLYHLFNVARQRPTLFYVRYLLHS
jgi:hypothetical protein